MPDRNPQEGRPFLCRIGWHDLEADFPNRLDRCRRCPKTSKLYVWTPTSKFGRWLLRLFR